VNIINKEGLVMKANKPLSKLWKFTVFMNLLGMMPEKEMAEINKKINKK
jgi:hypothetical protein